MPDPLISIVLPTYNGARFLRQSIQSCLDQTYTHWQLIVVNDCSTDNTLEIAQEFAQADSRIQVVTNPVNLKLPLSLNKGFELAQGEYFTWTSDDNYYAPHALATMLEALQANPQCQLVYADDTLVDDDNRVTGTWGINDVNTVGVAQWRGAGACFLYQSQVHQALKGYDPGAFLIEDYDFFLRGYLKFNYLYLQRTDLYFYRHHGGSLTHRYHRYVNDMHKLLHEKYLPQIQSKTTDADLALLYRKQAVYHALQKHDYAKSGHYLSLLAKADKRNWLITLMYIGAMSVVEVVRTWWLIFSQLVKNLFA